uniref:Uncharacterized protein n=1 Tax=Meloidogyne enterolobii TaxID=390850 RepID=A0A6V7XSM1_MELEN|nr:unnamed protein product [Meloidogyne enterolobii]
MIKFIILYVLYLNNCLNINCDGKLINVGVKIKEDWKEKREFIYLEKVELKERFVLIMNVKQQSLIKNYLFDKIGSFCKLEINPVKKVFFAKLNNCSKFSSQLIKKVLIEIANNKIIQQFLHKMEKRVLLNNIFIKNKNFIRENIYETSIIEDLIEINNNFKSIEDKIENYKNKLLTSYWTEINLIGYKIELLETHKVEYSAELKTRIDKIGKKISKLHLFFGHLLCRVHIKVFFPLCVSPSDFRQFLKHISD